jgi:aldose 1-epimerase
MPIQIDRFGKIDERTPAKLYTLTNRWGLEAKITRYGTTLVALKVADRHGHFEDVTLGYDSLDDYRQGQYYFGCTVGRYANRIADGRFTLMGQDYSLT